MNGNRTKGDVKILYHENVDGCANVYKLVGMNRKFFHAYLEIPYGFSIRNLRDGRVVIRGDSSEDIKGRLIEISDEIDRSQLEGVVGSMNGQGFNLLKICDCPPTKRCHNNKRYCKC